MRAESRRRRPGKEEGAKVRDWRSEKASREVKR